MATDDQMRPALDALGDDVGELCSILAPVGRRRSGPPAATLANGPHDLGGSCGEDAVMIITDDRLDRRLRRVRAATGWDPKPQGLCRGEVCVPAPGACRDDGTIDVAVAAERLGMPLVHDAEPRSGRSARARPPAARSAPRSRPTPS